MTVPDMSTYSWEEEIGTRRFGNAPPGGRSDESGTAGGGVTMESMFRMGHWAARNVADCFDGTLAPDNVINREVLD